MKQTCFQKQLKLNWIQNWKWQQSKKIRKYKTIPPPKDRAHSRTTFSTPYNWVINNYFLSNNKASYSFSSSSSCAVQSAENKMQKHPHHTYASVYSVKASHRLTCPKSDESATQNRRKIRNRQLYLKSTEQKWASQFTNTSLWWLLKSSSGRAGDTPTKW